MYICRLWVTCTSIYILCTVLVCSIYIYSFKTIQYRVIQDQFHPVFITDLLPIVFISSSCVLKFDSLISRFQSLGQIWKSHCRNP